MSVVSPGNDHSGCENTPPGQQTLDARRNHRDRGEAAEPCEHEPLVPWAPTRESRMPAPQAANNIRRSVGVLIIAALSRLVPCRSQRQGLLAPDRHQQAVKDGERRRRMPGHLHIHRQHVCYAIAADKALREHAA